MKKIKKYDIIYSLGSNCSCAIYMQKAKLRSCAGPFDWLGNINFSQKMDLILNDFIDFLNPEDLRFMPDNVDNTNHDHYENIKNGLYFFHDFSKNVPLSEDILKVKEKYNRRINRFYHNLFHQKRALLIWISYQYETSDQDVINATTRLCQKLGRKIDFLIIEHTDNLSSIIKRNLSDNIIRYNCHIKKYDNNGKLDLMGNEETVLSILEQYHLVVPWKQKIKRTIFNFLKIFIKICSSVIPIKKWRHSIRDTLLSKLYQYE